MATVTVNSYQPPAPPPVVRSVTITLDQAEASTLLRVLNNIGGDARTTARGYLLEVTRLLEAAGVVPLHKDRPRPDVMDGSIYFRPGTR